MGVVWEHACSAHVGVVGRGSKVSDPLRVTASLLSMCMTEMYYYYIIIIIIIISV